MFMWNTKNNGWGTRERLLDIDKWQLKARVWAASGETAGVYTHSKTQTSWPCQSSDWSGRGDTAFTDQFFSHTHIQCELALCAERQAPLKAIHATNKKTPSKQDAWSAHTPKQDQNIRGTGAEVDIFEIIKMNEAVLNKPILFALCAKEW